MWRNVRFAHNSLHTICDNADRIVEGAKLAPKLFAQQVYHSPIKINHSKHYGCESLTFLLHWK